MTVAPAKNKSLLQRAIDTLNVFEYALEHGPYDYVLDRIVHLETEMARLKSEIEQIQASKDGMKTDSQ